MEAFINLAKSSALGTLVALCLSTALAHHPAAAQEALAQTWHDDFIEDRLESYQSSGEVSWASGRLEFGPKSSLAYDLEDSPHVVVLTDLLPRRIDETGHFEFVFNIEKGKRCVVRIQAAEKQGDSDWKISLLSHSETDDQPQTSIVRESKIGRLAGGVISAEYRHGLVIVKLGTQEPWLGYIKNNAAQVESISIDTNGVKLTCTRLSTSVAHHQAASLTESDTEQLAVASTANENLMKLYQQGRFAEAAEQGEKVLEIRQAIRGETHPHVAASLNNLAALYYAMGNYTRTQPLFEKTAALRRLIVGELHPDYAQSLNNLAALHKMAGRYAEAELLFRQASDVWKNALGSNHPEYATSLHNLAQLYFSTGEYVAAEKHYRESSEIVRQHFGDDHFEYATSLHNLAQLYEVMGDFTGAERLYQQAMIIREEALGTEHPAYASVLSNLGGFYRDRDNLEQAEQMLTRSLEIHETVFGKSHSAYAASLNNLALLYRLKNQNQQATELYKQSLMIIAETVGEQHPDYARGLNNLAAALNDQGDTVEAEKNYIRAIAIRKESLGDEHPDYAASLYSLGQFYFSQGEYDRAATLVQEASDIQRRRLDENSIVQSSRQQRVNQNSLRAFLDLELANAVEMKTAAEPIVEAMWKWKGSVTTRQQTYRRLASDPSLALLYTELKKVSQQLSATSISTPLPPNSQASKAQQQLFRQKREHWQDRMDELISQREDLERQIAAQSESFRALSKPLTVAQVQQQLPDKSALIDFIEYHHPVQNMDSELGEDAERLFLAFIIRPDQPAVMVPLGSAQNLNKGIENFRNYLSDKYPLAQKLADIEDAGNRVRKNLWEPLETYLQDIETVIVCPDTTLGLLPFVALPGKSGKGSYLIDDYRFVTLPVVHQLQWSQRTSQASMEPSSLLLVGNVDYENQSDPPALSSPTAISLAARSSDPEVRKLRSNSQVRFEELDGFQSELELVKNLFTETYNQASIISLSGREATESEFLNRSSGADIIHVITHGYFAGDEIKSLDQTNDSGAFDPEFDSGRAYLGHYLPGLLSGLAMAGANQSDQNARGIEDGILRASEIEASPLQDVELVVLSACETGLGQVAGGEGITGLQRSFQIAGARSVVASLWKVDDAATVELMRQFYTNLWTHKMSRLEALRQAQLSMLDHYDIVSGEMRGLGAKPVKSSTQPKTKDNLRLHPKFWAAFQLSGDWL